jgi:enoyl-CoA hydratase/carnithine racemase
MITAKEAVQFGLINKAVPLEELPKETRTLAEVIVQASPLAVSMGKEAFYTQVHLADSQAYDYAKQTMVANLFAEDAEEGLTAFLEKRPPAWKGK